MTGFFHPLANRGERIGALAMASIFVVFACGNAELGGAPGAKGTGGSHTSGAGGTVTTGGSAGTSGSLGSGGAGGVLPDGGDVGGGEGAAGGGNGGSTGDGGEPVLTCTRTVPVANTAALGPAISSAMPGDCIELADGAYTFPTIAAKGTEAAPIIIRAANLLKVTVTSGDVSLDGAAYVIVQGLTFSGSGSIVLNDCDHCRFSRSRVQRSGGGEWIYVNGLSKYCRLDHLDIGPQNSGGNMIQLGGAMIDGKAQTVQYTRIDHNYFHDVHYGGGNGWECIRAGLSWYSMSSAFSTIEHNFFFKADNDPETVSLKSSENIFRYNTMRATKGQFSLRHGNGTQVYGNYILGDGVGGAQGIRVCGGNHKIFNNYVEGVGTPGIWLEGGEHDDNSGALTDHKQVYNTTVAFNTIVNNQGIELGGSHPMQPKDCTVAYNVLQGSGQLLTQSGGTTNSTYIGNIVNGNSSVGMGTMKIDPKLVKVGEVFKIGPDSPAIDAATMPFPFVTDDIDGKPRMKPDIGADESSSEPAKYGLLSAADVGPMAP